MIKPKKCSLVIWVKDGYFVQYYGTKGKPGVLTTNFLPAAKSFPDEQAAEYTIKTLRKQGFKPTLKSVKIEG